jgi:hypothetical protein
LSDLGFLAFRPSVQVVRSGVSAGLGEITLLLPSWRAHPEAANLSPDDPHLHRRRRAARPASLRDKGMPTTVASIRADPGRRLLVANG